MINFFRKIRQGLLFENKFTKYLLYAIGEIVLVVVGILIALQINNWNENQKNVKNLDIYLTAFQESLKDDVEDLKTVEEVNIFRMRSINYLMQLTGNRQIPEVPNSIIISNKNIPEKYSGDLGKELDNHLIKLAFIWTTRPNLVQKNAQVFDELKNTGMFSMIAEPEIKKAINKYYHDLEWRFSLIKEEAQFGKNLEWRNYLKDEIGILENDIPDMDNPLELLKQKRTVLHLRDFGQHASNRAKNAGDMKQLALDLISLIENRDGEQ